MLYYTEVYYIFSKCPGAIHCRSKSFVIDAVQKAMERKRPSVKRIQIRVQIDLPMCCDILRVVSHIYTSAILKNAKVAHKPVLWGNCFTCRLIYNKMILAIDNRNVWSCIFVIM
jgi:hypothetical protein